jgi:peptidoglycan/xylan/chitin deacetylase (PgdA/CDA1 family)
MRLPAVVCALAIAAILAAFLWQGAYVPTGGSPSKTQTAPAVGLTQAAVTTVEERIAPLRNAPSAKLVSASEVPPSDLTVLARESAVLAAATPTGASQASAGVVRAGSSCPGNPNALGISRVVEIDTTGGPGFGFEQFKAHDFLREGEVVLTFDDGPWPRNTQRVLAALAAHCTKAIFFPIGLHATYEPAILKQVAAAGHAIGSHTWCHQDLSKTKGTCLVNGRRESIEYVPKDEIEKGISAVHWAVGGPTASYFRFPGLKQPPDLVEYLGKRNIGIFSTDFDSFDFKLRKPEQIRQGVLAKLKKHGKGIVLMHDFQHGTAEAIADLLNDLKAAGYKTVFMKPKFSVTTIASYDELILKEMKVSTRDSLPTSSIVRTISE